MAVERDSGIGFVWILETGFFENTHSARSSNLNVVSLFPKLVKKHCFTNETVLLNSAFPNSSSKSKQRITNSEIQAAGLAFAEHIWAVSQPYLYLMEWFENRQIKRQEMLLNVTGSKRSPCSSDLALKTLKNWVSAHNPTCSHSSLTQAMAQGQWLGKPAKVPSNFWNLKWFMTLAG